MMISPSALAVFFGRAGDSPVSLQLEDGGLRVLRNAGEEFIPYERIDEPFLERNLFWASLFLGLKDGSFVTGRGFSKAAATVFSQEISNKQTAFAEKRLTDELQERSPAIMALAAQIRTATSGSRYLRYRDCEALLTLMQPLGALLKARDDQVPSPQLRVCLELITKFASASENARQNREKTRIQGEENRFREFFDHIEAHPLTVAQRTAVV